MPLPDLTSPDRADDIARFGGNGQPSPVAKIDYNVPLPGAYSINRVVPLSVPAEWFPDEAARAGTSLIDLGVVQGDEGALRGIDTTRLGHFYRRALPAGLRPSLRAVAKVGGDVSPLLTELQRVDGQDGGAPNLLPRRADGEVLDVLERRRIVAEPDDVDIQDRRTSSYLEQLSQGQTAVLPPVPVDRVQPRITMPVPGFGHTIREIEIDPVARAAPRLALMETWELRSYLGDYGLGRTLQTFSLLPGERTTITVETWRTDAATRDDSSSIFDSSDSAAQSRFASSVSTETGSAFQDQGGWAVSVATSASVGGSFLGIVEGSASVEAGFAANHQEASQRWSNNIGQAASEHANQVNNSRRQAVQSSSTTTTSSGSTTTTVREIANTNLRRVLNFVFRELNQTYETYVVLRDIKLVFYNGRVGSADIAPLGDLRAFLGRHVAADHQEEAARFLLGLCVERLGADGEPAPVLQFGRRPDGRRYEWESAKLAGDGTLDFGDNPLDPAFRWRFRPGVLTEGDERRINGLITMRSDVVLRTDNMIVEALLGEADALDPYASALQALDLEAREADVDWRRADTRRTSDALDLVSELPAGSDRIEAWTKLFPDEPEIEVVPVAAVNNDGNN